MHVQTAIRSAIAMNNSFRKSFSSFWRERGRKAVTDVLLCLPVSVLVHRRRLLFWENVHLPIKPSLKTTPVCCRDGRCVWLVPYD